MKLNLKSTAMFFLIAFNLSTAFAEINLKLNCQLKITNQDQRTGFIPEPENISVIFEVIQDKNWLSIESDIVNAYSEKKLPIVEVRNFSNDNRWNLFNKVITNFPWSVSIIIDRNTGQIWFERDFNGELYTKGVGVCEKIDKAKKKF